MAAFKERILGTTGLNVGPLGLAASYGAPAEAFEEAFDRGCNYFYLGSLRHRAGMQRAVRNLCGQGRRDRMVVAIQSYARSGLLMEYFFKRNLRSAPWAWNRPIFSYSAGTIAGHPKCLSNGRWR